MANVRCPMCSKVNSPEAETCAFCGARIKPVGSSPELPNRPAAKPEDDADWLSGLRSGTSAEDSSPGSQSDENESAGDGNVPDWLSRIRSRARTELGDSSEIFDDAASQPDWLNGIQETPETGDAAREGGEEEPDWLNRLQGQSAQAPGQAEEEIPAESPAVGEESDWLSNLGGISGLSSAWAGEEQAPGFNAAQPPAGESDFSNMNWLNSLSPDGEQPADETAAPEKEESSGFGLTGFLSSLDRGDTPMQAPEAAGSSVEDAGFSGPYVNETPDWLKGFSGQEEEPVPGESSLPEWKAAPEEHSSPAEFSGWLSAGETQPPAGQNTTSSADESLPDWFSSGETSPEAQPPATPAEEESGFLNWLSTQGEQPPDAQPGALESSSEQSSAEGLPAWLMETSGQETGEKASPAAQPDSKLPDWFASFDSPEQETGEQQPTAGAEEPQPGWLAAFEEEQPAEEAPVEEVSFAVEQEASPEVPQESAEPAVAPAPFIDDETPLWLRDFAAPAQAETEQGIPAFVDHAEQPQVPAGMEEPFASDLPEWLSEEATPQPAEQVDQPVETGEEEISRAELPSWVAAMRPVESLISEEPITDESDQRAEKAGPLAGMRGVLPVADHLFRYRKPPIYSAKLRVTEKQRTQASLMESIMAQESQPLLIPPKTVSAPRLIMRILIAFVLVMAMLVPALPGVGLDSLSMPVLYPAELIQMYQRIDQNLPQGSESTVLLAVDYEPGLSGEMSAAASPVVSHLMSKNVRIVVVSTVPSGPILAERLLKQVAAASAPGYSLNDRVVNLGYLPGGTISLLEFVQRPQFAAPATLSGALAWQDTFLQNMQGFQDFAQVIVLTDTAETGRAWIEQVSPLMGSTPLFFVASAQAAPLLIPYLEDASAANPGGQHSGQINGMVSGMMGGAQYGWVAQQANNPASRYWASYQIGVVIVIVLILVGGLYSGMKRLFSRNEKEEA